MMLTLAVEATFQVVDVNKCDSHSGFCCGYFVGTSEPIFRHTLDGLGGDV